MSMMKRLLAILAVACVISPVAAQKARVDFDHASDFSHYQTYRWAAPPNADVLNQIMQLRVMGFVEEALAAKRLRRVETGGDLLVNFEMDVRQEKVYTTFADTTGFG
jgi:predicted class III extradiol MEMO1 family dioxygenase